MTNVRRMVGAMALAVMMAAGLGTATLEARKPGGGGGNAAICSYLKSLLDYPNLSPQIRAYVEWLYYDRYQCASR